MKQGVAPAAALKQLLAADLHSEVRQVAFVDVSGRAAAHTGASCIPGAGHHVGDGYTTEALIYLDPPFKSNQDYNVLFTEQDGSRAAAQIVAFEDTWQWDQASSAAFHETAPTWLGSLFLAVHLLE
jgi:16S rRNA G966 N2-methylase RsmD